MFLRSLRESIRGQGTRVLISGEAGIGKTALVHTVTVEARQNGALVLTGSCYDLVATAPYGLWIELIRQYPSDTGLPDLPRVLIRGTGMGDLRSQLQLFEVARDFFLEVSRSRPLATILEDMHWSDPGSLEALRYVARSASNERMLVVATYRDDEITPRSPHVSTAPGTCPGDRGNSHPLAAN